MQDILYMIIPAYNEEATIKGVLEEWLPVIERHSGNGKSRLVVVNDGSTDRTLEILREFQNTHPVVIVLNKHNGGHGRAVRTGYDYAIHKGADYVFQTDSDGQTSASGFEAFWRDRKKYDYVLGYRKNRQDGHFRKMTAGAERFVIWFYFHVFIWDANVPYRLMNADALREDLSQIPEDAFLVNMYLTILAGKRKRKIQFRVISFGPRAGGKNSINPGNIVRTGIKACVEFPRLTRRWK